MSKLVKAVSDVVPDACHSNQVGTNNCRVSLAGLPRARVTVDLDCETLEVSDQKRCDYLVACARDGKGWVALLELKAGRFDADGVIKQLKGGAVLAHGWLPSDCAFCLVPVLVHGRGVHRRDRRRLRAARIALRNQEASVQLMRCGKSLADVLA